MRTILFMQLEQSVDDLLASEDFHIRLPPAGRCSPSGTRKLCQWMEEHIVDPYRKMVCDPSEESNNNGLSRSQKLRYFPE
jgi:hypothetical protein